MAPALHPSSARPRAVRLAGAGLALAASLFVAQAAHAAMYLCTDDRGVTLRLAQKIETSLIAMKCVEEHSRESRIQAVETRAPAIIPLAPVRTAVVNRIPAAGRAAPVARERAQVIREPAGDLDSLIRKVAVEFGHDPHLLKAIVHVESRFNPGAVSPKGAIGLMQVIPSTGQRFGLDNPRRQLLEPEHNLRTGAKYLSFLKERFADRLDLVLAAYNAGEGAVEKYRNTIPPYAETRSYVKSVLQAYATYRR